MARNLYAVTLADPDNLSDAEIGKFALLTDWLYERPSSSSRRRYEMVPPKVAAQLQDEFRDTNGSLNAFVVEAAIDTDGVCSPPAPRDFNRKDWVQCSEDRRRVVNIMLPQHICATAGDPDEPDLQYLQTFVDYFRTSTAGDATKRKVLFGLIALARCR